MKREQNELQEWKEAETKTQEALQLLAAGPSQLLTTHLGFHETPRHGYNKFSSFFGLSLLKVWFLPLAIIQLQLTIKYEPSPVHRSIKESTEISRGG